MGAIAGEVVKLLVKMNVEAVLRHVMVNVIAAREIAKAIVWVVVKNHVMVVVKDYVMVVVKNHVVVVVKNHVIAHRKCSL